MEQKPEHNFIVFKNVPVAKLRHFQNYGQSGAANVSVICNTSVRPDNPKFMDVIIQVVPVESRVKKPQDEQVILDNTLRQKRRQYGYNCAPPQQRVS